MKFQVGDRVKALEGYIGQFTAGKIYTVTGYTKYGSVGVVDDRGTPNGWGEDRFELVPSFQIGDMVKVEFEAVVRGANGSAVDVNVRGANYGTFNNEFVTLVERPIVLPTGKNALIETASLSYLLRRTALEWQFCGTGRYYKEDDVLRMAQSSGYRVIFEGENA